MTYDGYPPYPQPPAADFVHEVSVVDLLFQTGTRARELALRAERTRP